jgi:hypothetical protein
MRAPWVILLCIVFLLIGSCAGFFTGMLVNLTKVQQALTPESVDISVDAPNSVRVGETFTIKVTVTDRSGQARRIRDLDIEQDLLQGASITGITPKPATTTSIFGYASHTMNLSVPASGSTTVTFTLTATAPGSYSGDIDTYIDSDFAFLTNTIQIDITE